MLQQRCTGGSAAAVTLDTLRTGLELALRPTAATAVDALDGITSWIHGWKRNGWKTSGKQPVKNADLCQALDAATALHSVEWRWVKGHSGDVGNERADALANAGAALAVAMPT